MTPVPLAPFLAIGTPGDEVARPSYRCRELAELRSLPQALMGGTRAMRQAGGLYMPQHEAESPGTYTSRLRSTHLYGAFAETINRQAAKLFAKPIIVNDDVPEKINALCENIDGQGRALTPFGLDCIVNALVDGVSYILVDSPQLPPGLTLADQKTIGARPYWVLITACDVLGWRTETLGGAIRLSQLRVRENKTEVSGEFGEREVERVRVYEPGRWRLYEKIKTQTKEEWILVGEGRTALPEISIAPVYANRSGYFEGIPVFSSLAELCAEHWASSSEQRHALTFARFAMLKVIGVDDSITKIEVGPDKTLRLPLGADAAYIEHSGKGIEAGRLDLESIEKRMQSAGMQIRIEGAGKITATSSAIDSAESNSGMKAIAKGLEDAIELALQFTADMLKLPSGGTVEVYDEFAELPAEGAIPDLLGLRVAREISRDTLWTELQRRHMLSDDFDSELEAELLDAEAPPEPLELPAPPQSETQKTTDQLNKQDANSAAT